MLPDFSVALSITLQSHGIGPLKGNTMLANWFRQSNKHFQGLEILRYGHNLRSAFHQGYNLVIFHCATDKWDHIHGERDSKRIDIWWKEDDDSSRLMLLFAYLVTRNRLWQDADIRVLALSSGTFFHQSARYPSAAFFPRPESPLNPHVVADMNPETILEFSSTSSLVFLPFRIQHSRLTDVNGFSLERILPRLPAAAMVMAAEAIDLDSEPEEGTAAELAKAMDDLYDAEKRLAQSERDEEKVTKEIEKITARLTDSKTDDLERAELKKDPWQPLNKQKERLFRKTAKSKNPF